MRFVRFTHSVWRDISGIKVSHIEDEEVITDGPQIEYHKALDKILSNESIVVVEQDIDFTPMQKEIFANEITKQPNNVLVAPYLLYPKSVGTQWPVWSPRQVIVKDVRYEWCIPNYEWCDIFGLGMTYIPHELWQDFRTSIRGKELPKRDLDSKLSFHLHFERGMTFRVEWRVTPAHYHF